MASVLIVAEIQKGSLRESSYELASFAQKLAGASGRDVKSLVLGSECVDVTRQQWLLPRSDRHANSERNR